MSFFYWKTCDFYAAMTKICFCVCFICYTDISEGPFISLLWREVGEFVLKARKTHKTCAQWGESSPM